MISRQIKNDIKFIASLVYGVFSLKSSKRIQIPILCYHSVQESNNFEGDSLKPSEFENHLKYLKKNHTIISLEDAFKFISKGDTSVVNPVVITFDDGYEDNYNIAFPLLKKHESHATFFVVTSFIDGDILLIDDPSFNSASWEQICEMDASQFIDIGAHTDTHRLLSKINDKEIEQEIYLSKEKLENKLGHNINLFAYPNGQKQDIPSHAVEIVKKAGFNCACSTYWRTTHCSDEVFELGRVMMSGGDSVQRLKSKVNGNFNYIYWIQEFKLIISGLLRK